MSSRARNQPRPLWHPALWPSWLAVGLGWLLTRLPTKTQVRLGSALGHAFWCLAKGRRQVALTNLQLCFPEQSDQERTRLAKSVFAGMGVAMMETLWTWLGNKHNDPAHVARTHIDGLEILHEAHAQGRGVLLIGAHLMAMDAISARLCEAAQIDVIYRYNKNPVIEWLMVRGRSRYFPNVIEREDVRAIMQSLKEGNILWYAADQDYGAKHSVFAKFFGVPAATITGSARLARFRGSPVVIMSQHRDLAAHEWTIRFEVGPKNYPTDKAVPDAQTIDAQAINDAIEKAIRRTPEQYLWLHRRFKTRPAGEPKLY